MFIMKGELVGFTHKDKGPTWGSRVPDALHVFLFNDIILTTKPAKEKRKCFDDILSINDGFILHQHPRMLTLSVTSYHPYRLFLPHSGNPLGFMITKPDAQWTLIAPNKIEYARWWKALAGLQESKHLSHHPNTITGQKGNVCTTQNKTRKQKIIIERLTR